MLVASTVCALGLGLVIGGVVVVFGLRLFVDWGWWKPPTWLAWVAQEMERAGRVPLGLLGAGILAMIGGALFLAIDGC